MAGLEIGGGPAPLRPHFLQFDAIDWSERTGLSYELGDARNLPFPDGFFDHVFASNLLEHFAAEETTAVLAEWARVLVPGGALELVVPCAIGILRDFFTGINSWAECAERLLGSRDYEGNEHKTAFCYWEFSHIIERVPTLELLWIKASHNGGGVHSCSLKIEEGR